MSLDTLPLAKSIIRDITVANVHLDSALDLLARVVCSVITSDFPVDEHREAAATFARKMIILLQQYQQQEHRDIIN